MPLRTPFELRVDNHATDQAVELFERVGLADPLQRYPAQLSGGEQQRVALRPRFYSLYSFKSPPVIEQRIVGHLIGGHRRNQIIRFHQREVRTDLVISDQRQ